MMKLAPKGCVVRSRTWAISPGIASGRKADAPITPKPPALETAAARSGPAAVPMPAQKIGYSIPRSRQMGVRSPLAMSGIVAHGNGLAGSSAAPNIVARGVRGRLERPSGVKRFSATAGASFDRALPLSILDFAYQSL